MLTRCFKVEKCDPGRVFLIESPAWCRSSAAVAYDDSSHRHSEDQSSTSNLDQNRRLSPGAPEASVIGSSGDHSCVKSGTAAGLHTS